MYIRITLLICLINFIEQLNCIEIMRLSVPNQILEGSDVRLKCIYAFSAGEKSIYSLKWLAGVSEFYREMPKQPKQVFPLKRKFYIDLYHSGNGTVVIRNVTRYASGPYNCEVTSNPNMDTARQSKNMTVFINSNSQSIAVCWILLLVSLGSTSLCNWSLRRKIC